MLTPAWIMVLLNLWVGLSGLPKRASRELEVPSLEGGRLFSKGNILEGAADKQTLPYTIGWKYPVHPDTHIMIDWVDDSGRWEGHPSEHYSDHRQLNLRVPIDLGQGHGFKAPFEQEKLLILNAW